MPENHGFRNGRAATAALRLRASLESLDPVADYVRVLCASGALPEDAAYRLRLAADEIATNIVQHGYRGGEGRLEVTGGVEDDRVWVRLRDDAPPFDPRQGLKEPDVDLPASQRRIGGLGVYLALTALDGFDYELEDGRNVSILTVHRTVRRVRAAQTCQAGAAR